MICLVLQRRNDSTTPNPDLGYKYFGLTQEAIGWFLTWPRLDIQPDELLEKLKLCSGTPIKEYIVCRELHKDGQPHAHAFIKYERKVEWGARKWDIDDHHGDYQQAKSWRAAEKYCQKGGDYISNFDVEAAASKKSCGRELNRRLLQEDLTALVHEGVIPLEKYLKLKACKDAFFKDCSPVLPRCSGFIPNSLGKLLPINEGKLRHYWLWSRKPNTGKTTFLKLVAKSYPSYWLSYKESFQSLHPGTQFVLLDEYSAPHLQITQLNQMCDGTWMYPTKGGSPVQLDEPILLVCSNKPPEEVYPNQYPLINVRFSSIELS